MKIKFRNHLDQKKRNRRLRWLGVTLAIVSGLLILTYLDKQVRLALFGSLGIDSVSASAQFSDFDEQNTLLKTSISASSSLGLQDMRAFVLDQYFLANQSPLYGTGNLFVAACDKYATPKDCTTLAAIARAETDLCKYGISATYYNCWGYGGGGIYRIHFDSWERSIETVTMSMALKYGNAFILDPSTGEKVFCGSEPGCTGWGNRVKYHMQLISDYAKQLGFDKSLFELR